MEEALQAAQECAGKAAAEKNELQKQLVEAMTQSRVREVSAVAVVAKSNLRAELLQCLQRVWMGDSARQGGGGGAGEGHAGEN